LENSIGEPAVCGVTPEVADFHSTTTERAPKQGAQRVASVMVAEMLLGSLTTYEAETIAPP
jgi:hypothetical protein